jgi:flagellar protein FliS
MMNNPYARYKAIQVSTASQGRLILMLYDGALKNLRQAQRSIAEKDINGAHNCLMKAQAIIWELDSTLNMDAGSVAENLRSLYRFMTQHLVKANIAKDAAMVEQVISLLLTLKEGWDAIILKRPSVIG